MPIRRPLSPGGGWVDVSLYRAYADSAYEHFMAGRYFDAIVVSCVGYDVLVNTLPDRIRLHHHGELTPDQIKVIDNIEASERMTAGKLLVKLEKANILHWRLNRAFMRFNKERNNVIHPIERKEERDKNGNVSFSLSLKKGAVFPYKATKEDAYRYLRWFCHIIDLSGGESPRMQERVRQRYSLSTILEEIDNESRME